jgi:hypothetical protein
MAIHRSLCVSHHFCFFSLLELEKKNEESKKVLKQALMLQRELASLKGVLRDMVDTVEERTKSVRDTEDHSFQHFVDYKGIGAYESH